MRERRPAAGVPSWAWIVAGMGLFGILLCGLAGVLVVLWVGPGEVQRASLPPADMTLRAFILQKPAGPTTVHARCELSTHYNWVGLAQTHYSFSLEADEGGPTRVWAYAPKKSVHGTYLYNLLKNGGWQWRAVRLARTDPQGDALPADESSEFALVEVLGR